MNNENWIPINESQPDFDVPVLICQLNITHSIQIGRLNSIRTSKMGVTYDWLEGKSGYDECEYNITHWIPLPNIPTDQNK